MPSSKSHGSEPRARKRRSSSFIRPGARSDALQGLAWRATSRIGRRPRAKRGEERDNKHLAAKPATSRRLGVTGLSTAAARTLPVVPCLSFGCMSHSAQQAPAVLYLRTRGQYNQRLSVTASKMP